jgi:hypothetical protein
MLAIRVDSRVVAGSELEAEDRAGLRVRGVLEQHAPERIEFQTHIHPVALFAHLPKVIEGPVA